MLVGYPPSSLGRIPILVDRIAFSIGRIWSSLVLQTWIAFSCWNHSLSTLPPSPKFWVSPFFSPLPFPPLPTQSSVKGAVSRATRSTNPRTSCSSPEIWSSGTWGDGMLADSGNLLCLAVEMWRWKPLKASLSNHVRGKSWQHTGDASWFHW